jgi:peptidoglycan hydrolase-like protein with peptidoglycan-binding domain
MRPIVFSLVLFLGVFLCTPRVFATDLFTYSLSLGSSGSEVTRLQEVLRDAGYFPFNPTSYFGEKTREGLLAFQIAHRLSVSGVCDEETRAFLNNTGYGASDAENLAQVVDLLIALNIIPKEDGPRVRLMVDEYVRTGVFVSSSGVLKLEVPKAVNATKKNKASSISLPDFSLPDAVSGSTTLPSFSYGSTSLPQE